MGIEFKILDLLQNIRTPAGDTVMCFITRLGDAGMVWIQGKPDDFSFPSWHTAASFTAVAVLYFSGERKLWKPALAIACLIAFSRLYLYVH